MKAFLKVVYLLTILLGANLSLKALTIEGNVQGLRVGDSVAISIRGYEKQILHNAVVAVKKANYFMFEKQLDQPPFLCLISLNTPNRKLIYLASNADKLKLEGSAADFLRTKVRGGFYDNARVSEYDLVADTLDAISSAHVDSMRRAMAAGDSIAQKRHDEASNLWSDKMEALQQKFILDNPDLTFSASLLYDRSGYEKLAVLKQSYDAFTPQVQQSFAGKKLKDGVDKRMLTAEGTQCPDVLMKDMNGAQVALSDYRGQYVLLDFWASWCGWCRKGNKTVVRLYEEYKDRGFTVLGISYDRNPESWKKAVEKDGLVWTQVYQKDNPDVAKFFYIQALPTYMLVSPEGKIVMNFEGGLERVETILKENLD